MQEYDLYINPRRPTIGLYVRKGAALPDLADATQWKLDGTVGQNEVPADIAQRIAADGHAFQELANM